MSTLVFVPFFPGSFMLIFCWWLRTTTLQNTPPDCGPWTLEAYYMFTAATEDITFIVYPAYVAGKEMWQNKELGKKTAGEITRSWQIGYSHHWLYNHRFNYGLLGSAAKT